MLSIGNSVVVGYASLTHNKDEKCPLDALQAYCRDSFIEADIFAEVANPSDKIRPLWKQVLKLVHDDQVSVLVVPSLWHIAGDDAKATANVLRFLSVKGVRLFTLDGSHGSSQMMRILAQKHLSAASADEKCSGVI